MTVLIIACLMFTSLIFHVSIHQHLIIQIMLKTKIDNNFFKHPVLNNYFCLVHPCDKEDNGGCSQICKKNGTTQVCACQPDFKLSTDGKMCNKS